MTDHIRFAVFEFSRHFVVEIRREHHILCGFFPDIGLILLNPVRNRSLIQDSCGVLHPGNLEQKLFIKRERVVKVRLTLVKPENDIPKRLVVLIKTQNGITDDRQRHADNPGKLVGISRADRLPGFADPVVVKVRSLLRPAGLS